MCDESGNRSRPSCTDESRRKFSRKGGCRAGRWNRPVLASHGSDSEREEGSGEERVSHRSWKRPNLLILITDQERFPQHWPDGWADENLPNRKAALRLRAHLHPRLLRLVYVHAQPGDALHRPLRARTQGDPDRPRHRPGASSSMAGTRHQALSDVESLGHARGVAGHRRLGRARHRASLRRVRRRHGPRVGDRVATITTHNEPWVHVDPGPRNGRLRAGHQGPRRLAMQVSHHLLLSHGLALQALRAARWCRQARHRAQRVADPARHRLDSRS